MIPAHIEEFRTICRGIVSQKKKKEDWRATESDDEIQSEHFVGGFDATEDAFCFSYYSSAAGEQWFQISLEDVTEIASGGNVTVALRNPE